MGVGGADEEHFLYSNVAAHDNNVQCDLSFCREQFLVFLLSLDKSILEEVGI